MCVGQSANLVWLIYCDNRIDSWWFRLFGSLVGIRLGCGLFKHLRVFGKIKRIEAVKIKNILNLKC